MIPFAESEAAVIRLAERIGEKMAGLYRTAAASVTLAASVGCTYGPTEEMEALLRIADSNMYEHKAQRRSSGAISADT
ncbi:MAG: diguanylate cyclase domain-containing protein [Mycobacterium sp.]